MPDDVDDRPPDPEDPSGATSTGVSAELDRLRAKNARLRADAETSGSEHSAARTVRRRGRAAVALVVLASVMLPVSVLTVWTRNQVLDTDRYVETVAPLASDPTIQSSISNRISDEVAKEIDVKSLATEALPENAAFLAAPIASAADNLIQKAADRVVRSDAFDRLWIKANRAGHDGLVAAVTGRKGTVVSLQDGKAVLELGGLAEAVLKDVDQQFGLDLESKIPADKLNVTFVLVDSQQLADVQAGVRLLDRLSWLSVILTLGLFAGSVAVGTDRRRTTVRMGFGIAVSMLVLFVGFAVARDIYLTNLPSGVERADAAAVVFDTLTRLVLQAIRVLFVLGAVVLVAAWLAGPGRAAATVRSYWDRLLGRGSELTGSVVGLGPVPAWCATHLAALRATVLAMAVVVLFAWGRPTGKVVLLIALAALVVLGIVQLVAGMAASTAKEPV